MGRMPMDMSARTSHRLTRLDWLTAGIDLLQRQGAQALKAEPMARHMKTTKGSFYWHFRDVADFHGEVLSLWEEAADAALARIARETPGDVACLRAIAQSVADPGEDAPVLRAEPAIRSWAADATLAREAIDRVDEARIGRFSRLLERLGIGNPEVAHILLASAVGMTVMGRHSPSERTEAIGSLVDLVLALR